MLYLLFYGAGIRTGGTFLTVVSVGAGLSALTHSTLTVSPAAAQQADRRHAGVFACGAVTVFSYPASVALAESTATLAVT